MLIGVELFGEQPLSLDIEVIELFLKTPGLASIDNIRLDLGYVEIIRGLISQADLSSD